MKKPKTLITGASGKTGSATVMALLDQGYPVRAFVHRRDARSSYLEQAGAEVVVGQLEDVSSLSQAMQGVQRAYFVCPWTPNQLDLAMNFAVATVDNRLEHVVLLGQWLSHATHPSVATRRTYLTDRLITWLPDTTWTLINVGFFADNYMALLEPISQLGLMPMPLGHGKNAPVSNEDIGRTVARALISPEQHAGRTYRPTGPVLMSPEDIAETFGRVLRRSVRYQNISPQMFTKAARAMGLPIPLIGQLQHYFEEYRLGTFAVGTPNDAILHVTGREAEDFETIVRRYVEQAQVTGLMPSSARVDTRRTPINRLRALGNFLGLLLTPAPNLDRFERKHDYPRLAAGRYAQTSAAWTQDHDQPNAFGSERGVRRVGPPAQPISI